MNRKVNVIFLPLHRNIDKTISSESYWALNFLKTVRNQYTVKAYVGNISQEGMEFLGKDSECIESFELSSDRILKKDLIFYLFLIKLNLKNIFLCNIVHHFGSFGNFVGFNLSFLLPKLGRKYVIGPLLYPTNNDLDTAIKLGLLTEQHHYSDITKKFFKLFNKLTLMRSDYIIFDSEETEKIYEKEYAFLKKKKVKIIPGGGIDREIFYPPNPISLNTKLKIGVASNLIKSKNIDKLIYSLKHVKSDFILCIAGEGPEKANLLSIIQECGLSEKINFLGRINHDKLSDFYRNLDVYVALSEGPTMAKISVQEAMSCGNAIISADPIIKKRVKEEMWGYSVNMLDQYSIVFAIDSLIADKDKLLLMKKSASEFAKLNFSNLAILDKFSEVYKSNLIDYA